MRRGISTIQLIASQVVTLAIVVMGFVAYLQFFGLPGTPAPQPEPQSYLAVEIDRAMQGPTAEADRQTLSDQYAVFAAMAQEDGRRSTPLLATTAQLYRAMCRVGNANIGPDWRLGDRYPAMVDVLERHLNACGLSDESESLTPSKRSAFVAAAQEIARACGDS